MSATGGMANQTYKRLASIVAKKNLIKELSPAESPSHSYAQPFNASEDLAPAVDSQVPKPPFSQLRVNFCEWT